MLSRIAGQVGYAGLILLGFLLLFESYLEIPTWLQPFGRMHPLLLHLPIGVLALLAILPSVRKEIGDVAFGKVRNLVLDLGLILTISTSIFGLFLAQEDGYSPESLATHKWMAVALCILVYGLHAFQQVDSSSKIWYKGLTLLTLGVLVATGHFGGAITHGENYLWEPIQPKEEINLTKASLFVAAVEPILANKCNKCHNERKAKGKLVMSSKAGLLKGGESGPLWLADQPDSSLLLQRIHLPMELEEHMPPEGKPQLTALEKELIGEWIKAGADMDKTLQAYDSDNSARQLAERILEQRTKATAGPSYDFPPASAKVIESLNTPFCSVYPLAVNSPALAAKISVREYFKPAYITDLKQIRKQLTYLNLTDLPIIDEYLRDLKDFPNLEKLILNGTKVSSPNLETIGSLKSLRSLALSNTQVDTGLVELLKVLPLLEELYVWNTAIDSIVVDRWQQDFPGIEFHLGFKPDLNEKLKMSPPALANDKMLLNSGELVQLKHSLPGAIIRYTLDGAEPDSLASEIYQEPLALDGITTIRAKAFREGWESSETVSYTMFQAGLKPSGVKLLKSTSGNYRGSGESTLIDAEKGDASNFRSPYWLGFQDNPMEVLFTFEESKQVQEIVLSYAVNMGSYIMPPRKVEVWAGDSLTDLQKVHTANPLQPSQYGPNTVEAVTIPVRQSNFTHYKLVAYPVARLPEWHGGAGDRGWVFSDEVLFFGADD